MADDRDNTGPLTLTEWWARYRGRLLLAPALLLLWAVVLMLASWLREVFAPLILAGLLAYIFNPVITRMQRIGLPRVLGIAGLYLLLLVPLLMLVYFAGPGLLRELGRESNGLAAAVQEFKERLRDYLAQYSHLPGWIIDPREGDGGAGTRPPDADAMMPEHLVPENRDLLSSWTGLMQTILGFLLTKGWLGVLTTGTLLVGFYLFFLLLRWNEMAASIERHLPRPFRDPCLRAARRMDHMMAGFFRARLPIMLTVGLLTAGGLQACGASFSVLIGTLTGVATLVPVLPMVVGFVPSCISAYVSNADGGNPWAWTGVAAGLFLGVQVLEAWVLTPLVQGRRSGLHPMMVVLCLLIGAQTADAFGVLVSLPTACLVQVIFLEFVLPPLRRLAEPHPDEG